jgi:hypothetical protein
MQLETAKIIAEVAEDAGNENVSLREDYSGRGMYGQTTAGLVVGSLGDLLPLVAAAAAQLERQQGEEGVMDIDTFIGSLERIRTDNMGRDLIVY